MGLDPALIAALRLRRVGHGGAEAAHEAFQTSTLEALLDGRYEGDVSAAELARHGDLGIGTFDALDGELVLVDGEPWRADADGVLDRPAAGTRVPFAVATRFAADLALPLPRPLGQAELLALAERRLGAGARFAALRIDGRFARIHARSMPRQEPPYRPLAEVAAEQRVFDLRDVDATLVGFRFPDSSAGLNVAGWHLHAVTADRRRGGHVLDFALERGELALDPLAELHVELPPGTGLPSGPVDREAVERIERRG